MMMMIVGMLTPSLVFAQDNQERHWSLTLGAGAAMSPVYSGSDEFNVFPLPYIGAEYKMTYLDLFIAGDEAGLRLKTAALPGSNVSFGVKLGQNRDHDDEAVEDILAGTAKLENIVQGFAKLTWLSSVGQWSSSVNWLPTNAEYDEPGISDEEYHGLKISIDYTIGGQLHPKLFAFATVGTSWMNDDYAEAFHGVLYPTPQLEVFKAQAGLRDVHGTLGARYVFSTHIGGMLLVTGEQLLADAADSPLTKQEFQPGVVAMMSYSF
jgi:outer membrane scaffolding protein for murein synthesis (MipA/OmpV family)